mgnify:CR=1 FL=1
MPDAFFRSLRDGTSDVRVNRLITSVESISLEIDQADMISAFDEATSELRRIREGAVLSDLIEDVSA